MKKTDSIDVKDGKIDESAVIDCVINKNGPSIRAVSYTHLTLPTTPYV